MEALEEVEAAGTMADMAVAVEDSLVVAREEVVITVAVVVDPLTQELIKKTLPV